MSAPTSASVSAARRRPALLLVLVATVAVLAAAVAVLTPRQAPTQSSLASASASPRGALGLYQTLSRFGWPVRRATTPLEQASAGAVYVAVRSDHGVGDTTAARVLAAVRGGAGLVVDVRPGDPLSDSLKLVLDDDAGSTAAIDNGAAAAALDASAALRRPGCRGAGPADVEAGTTYASFALADSGPAAAPGRRVLLAVRRPRGGGAPVVVGFPYGRGRVVAVADASLLANAALRTCWAAAGPLAVRSFEYASAGAGGAPAARPPVVFLEGLAEDVERRQPSVLRAVRRALTEVPAGRAVTQMVAAALLLLAAAASRAIAPLPSPRVARRSPLEHVGALARAYREARASRVAARRLAAGLRRRYGGAAWGGPAWGGPAVGAATGASAVADDPDVRFLAGVAARHPARAADAERLAAALAAPIPPAEVVAVGAAAARIAEALAAARRGAAV